MIKKILIGTFMFLCLFNFSKFYAFSCNTNSIGDNFKLTLLSGGCDEARQFSFKSAYGVYRNLKLFKDIEIQILYVDDKMNAYIIDETYLHLNTHDFNLKICNNKKCDIEEFIKVLRQTDIVMPIVFGDFVRPLLSVTVTEQVLLPLDVKKPIVKFFDVYEALLIFTEYDLMVLE